MSLPLPLARMGLLAYRPFLDPMPVWDYWYLLLLPLTVGVAVVYKSIRCATMRRVPLEAAKATLYILVGMAFAAAVLLGVVGWLER
jgi:hypothetical protein